MNLELPYEYHDIADMLWACEDQEQVDQLLLEYGEKAFTVYQLMLLDVLDQEQNVEQSQAFLCKFYTSGV
jgi:hypothetical protein